jgi:hypothetical protein
MSDETRDPREAVLADWRWELRRVNPSPEPEADILARLDAADPLRQIWPEVVEALEETVRRANSRLREAKGEDYGHVHFCDHRVQHEATVRSLADTINDLLTRARATTPTGDDDE